MAPRALHTIGKRSTPSCLPVLSFDFYCPADTSVTAHGGTAPARAGAPHGPITPSTLLLAWFVTVFSQRIFSGNSGIQNYKIMFSFVLWGISLFHSFLNFLNTQAGLELAEPSSCLSLMSVGITGMQHHARLCIFNMGSCPVAKLLRLGSNLRSSCLSLLEYQIYRNVLPCLARNINYEPNRTREQ